MTYVEKLSDLMSKVKLACAFGRSKGMRYLLRHHKNPNGTIASSLIPIGTILAAIGVLIGLSAGGWILPGAVFGLSVIFAVVGSFVFATTNFCRFLRYEKQAQKAGVVVMNNADQPPSALTELQIVDKYEYWKFPPEQLAALKSLAQREDIPAGWWESAAQLIDQYQDQRVEKIRQQEKSEQAHQAEQRLAALSTVSVEPSPINAQEQKSVAKTSEDPMRFLL